MCGVLVKGRGYQMELYNFDYTQRQGTLYGTEGGLYERKPGSILAEDDEDFEAKLDEFLASGRHERTLVPDSIRHRAYAKPDYRPDFKPEE